MAFYATSPCRLEWRQGKVLIPRSLLREFGYLPDEGDTTDGVWIEQNIEGYTDPIDPLSTERTVCCWPHREQWHITVMPEPVDPMDLGQLWWDSMDRDMTYDLVQQVEQTINDHCRGSNQSDVRATVLVMLLEWYVAQHPHADFLVRHIHRMVQLMSADLQQQRQSGEWYERTPSLEGSIERQPAAPNGEGRHD